MYPMYPTLLNGYLTFLARRRKNELLLSGVGKTGRLCIKTESLL